MKPELIEKNYEKYKEAFKASLTGTKEAKRKVCEKYNVTMGAFNKYRRNYLLYCATPEEKELYEFRKNRNNVDYLVKEAQAKAEGKRLAYLTSLNLPYRTLMKVMTLVTTTPKEKIELKDLKYEMYRKENCLDKRKLNAITKAIVDGVDDELYPGQKRKMHPLDLYIKFEVTPTTLDNFCSNYGTKDQLLCLSNFLEKNREKFGNKKTFPKLIDEMEFAFSLEGNYCTQTEKAQYKQYMIDHKIPKNIAMFNEVGKRVQQGRIKLEEPTKQKTK